jgi:hypothetical protein
MANNPDFSSLDFVDYGTPETLCDGPFYVQPGNPISVITFTNRRPKVNPLFKENKAEVETVVSARIVVSHEQLINMRDLLNRLLAAGSEPPKAGAATAGGSSTIH